MSLIDQLLDKLQRHPKRVVFPEGEDPRVIQAARQIVTRRAGVPVLLGDRAEIKDRAARLDLKLDGIRIVEPERSDDYDLFLPMVEQHPRFADMNEVEKRAALLDKHNFAALMLATGRVDALVGGGATQQVSSGLRSLFKIVSLQEGVAAASSMMVLDPDREHASGQINRELFLADCGVIPDPSAEQLADIAVATAWVAGHLTNELPRVAFLSFATSAAKIIHPSIEKIRQAKVRAIERAAALGLEAEFDGEFQLDTALSPTVALQKGVTDDRVAGRANVLIFPDLNSGNIASKMIQLVAGARTYGQILTGLNRPCAEIGRGAHVYDIFGTAVITACQAVDRHYLYGTNGPTASR